jgi:peptide/nickel transport system substrate-binding protein
LEGGHGEWAIRESNVFADLFTKEEIHSIIKYDPEEARRLLREAGYPQGFSVKSMYTATDATATKAVELIQAQLKKVGINLELEPLDAAEVTTRKRARDFDTYWAGEAPRSDLDGSLYLAVHPTGAFNFNDVDDPKVTALLAAQRREADPAKRRELHREVLRYLNENAILNPTWRRTQFIFLQPYLKGWYHHADYRAIGSVWNTWLDK